MVDDDGNDPQVTRLDYGATLRPVGLDEPPLSTPIGSHTERYRLGDVIGQGGMGEVIHAFDEHIRRDVAVKRIRGDKPSSEDVARFVREARVQGRLEHPAVVPVHDIAIDRTGRPYFVMKRLSGIEMKVLLEGLRAGTISDEAATRKRLLRAFAEVCLAVELAHSRGIVHRDIKPANIMLGDFGEVYVIDWGIARALADGDSDRPHSLSGDLALETGDTRAGAVLGTPAYMAPEQMLGEPAGPAADIYALGCILFEIAAGVPLHDNKRSLAEAISAADSSPSARRADSPPELDAICQRATAADPAERFQSARALGGAVQDFLDGDRDVAARKELARHHLDEAQAARARSNGETDRRIAIRAAGRALALDPTATEAADLVSHLMLRPPDELPADVVQMLDDLDVSSARQQGRLGAIAMTGYLWFIPLLAWTGVRDWSVIVAFAVFALLTSGQVYWMTRRSDTIKPSGIYLSAVIHAVLIALVCRIVGPFIIAPTLVLTTLMAYAVHPKFGKIHIIAVILTAGVAVPWLLEATGVLPSTYAFVDGRIELSSPSILFSAAPVQLGFAVLLALLGAITAILIRSMASRQREATKTIEVQAWHLRQILATPNR